MIHKYKISGVVKCESLVPVFYFLLFFAFAGIYGQKEKEPKKAETVEELFNTSSCIPKPYKCPHPQIQYYLYTRVIKNYLKGNKMGREVLGYDMHEARTNSNIHAQFRNAYGWTEYSGHCLEMVVDSESSSPGDLHKKEFVVIRRTQNHPELIDTKNPDSLYYSQFNRVHPTKVVVHGFGGGRNLSPSTDMREAYFTRGNYNIIIVDYGTLVKEPCLKQMEWAPRFCAKCIAHLVRYLTQHPRGVKADDLHLIGYSVGAHISGLVANYLSPTKDGKLGRITGLDPTIVFYMGNNRSRDLDYTDAHFVDIMHTGAGILGQWGPTGHADFYINGGSSQPGCASDTLFETLACDHTKVTPYFIESIVTPKGFWAYPCPTLISYLLGICNPGEEDYVLMGELVTHKARGIYYVSTNPDPPFAKGHPGRRGLPSLIRRPQNRL